MPSEPSYANIHWHSVLKARDSDGLEAILNRLTDEIDPNRPQAIDIERTNGDRLTVLLGSHQSFVSFTSASGDPPYYVSLGDPSAEGVITFYVDGDHHSEMHARHTIEMADAHAAVLEFVSQCAGLPRCATWTEV